MPRRAEADLKVAGRGDASCTRTRRDNSRPLARESSDPIEEDKRRRNQQSSSRNRWMSQQEHHLPHPDDDNEALGDLHNECMVAANDFEACRMSLS